MVAPSRMNSRLNRDAPDKPASRFIGTYLTRPCQVWSMKPNAFSFSIFDTEIAESKGNVYKIARISLNGSENLMNDGKVFCNR